MRTVLEFLDPFNKRGFYAIPGLLLIAAAAVAVLVVIALTAQAVLNAHFYRSHFKAPLHVPHTYKAVHVSPKVSSALPAAASIHFAYFMTAINDQGSIGSCQSWSFSKQLSYAANWNRQANGTHLHHFFSPRYGYDTVSNGQDAGSYLEQYPPIAQTGIPRWIAFPYPPYQVDYPVPAVAPLSRLNTTEHQLFAQQGAGSGGLALIKQALSTHHAVNVDFPVYPEYDAATQHSGNIGVPSAGETDRGGHANVAVAYDDSHYNSTEGTYGAVLVSNQWGNNWGTAAAVTGSSVAGYGWMSYNFVETYVWDAAVIHVSTALTAPPHAGGPASADGGNAAQHHPPYHFQGKARSTAYRPPTDPTAWPSSPSRAKAAGLSWHVQGVRTTDGQDISGLINSWGDHFNVWPLGLAATVGTESGYNTRSERWAGGLDNSCGLLQQIITNVYPVIHNYDARTACNWEEVPSNSIYLGASLYAQYFAYQHNCVRWTFAYGMYNAGPGWPCSWYYNMSGQAYTNYAFNFLPNYQWAVNHFQSFGPVPRPHPSPKPAHKQFPGHRWCRYARSHGTHCPTHRWHKRDTDIAKSWRYFLDHAAGGAVTRERWNPRLEMERQVFAQKIAYSWPKYPRIVKWANRPRKHRA